MKELLKDFRKDKPVFSGGNARRLLGLKTAVPRSAQFWVERWLTQKVQENCWPPQVGQKDGWAVLQTILPPEEQRRVLAQLRADFQRDHPLLVPPPPEEDGESESEVEMGTVASRRTRDTQSLSQAHSLQTASQYPSPPQTVSENPQ